MWIKIFVNESRWQNWESLGTRLGIHMHHSGALTKDFVLYSEVSFAQGITVDHAPLLILASYAGARL